MSEAATAPPLPFAEQISPPGISSRSRQVIVSRDEMNLAEFPLTVLSTRSNPSIKTLEFTDTIRGKNGEPITREWIITGADKFGLPTATDDEILLGLLKLTVDNSMRERKVFFTRYELLRVLQWSTEGRSYRRLQGSLDRLSGVRIKATNAFYDNEAKSHSTRNFGIIDAYELNDGRDPHKPSYFIWSEALFHSFQVGFIKKLDFDFFLSLSSSIAKRVYRYLDKHFWYRSKISMNVFTFAHEKIGISRNYRYVSSLRQQLDPAIEELLANGFLSSCEFVGKGKDTEIVLCAGSGKPRKFANSDLKVTSKKTATTKEKAELSQGEAIQGNTLQRVSSLLVERGLKPRQVEKLTSRRSEELLNRISSIIEHYDLLIGSGSPLVSRSPVGFLYRAIENPEDFVLPGEGKRSPQQTPMNFTKKKKEDRVAKEEAESAYLTERRKEIEKLKAAAEPEMLDNIREEVEGALSRIRGAIGEGNFKAAVEHGVEEKIANLFAFPSFDEWLAQRSRASEEPNG